MSYLHVGDTEVPIPTKYINVAVEKHGDNTDS